MDLNGRVALVTGGAVRVGRAISLALAGEGIDPDAPDVVDRLVAAVRRARYFGAFLSGANPGLPKAVVADLVKHHVVTLKDVIDAQAAKDHARAFVAERTGAGHMQMIADPLAKAIVRLLSDRALRLRMSEAALDWAHRFDWETCYRESRAVFESAARGAA